MKKSDLALLQNLLVVLLLLANADDASAEADILSVPPFPGAGTKLKLNADFSLRPEIDDHISTFHHLKNAYLLVFHRLLLH